MYLKYGPLVKENIGGKVILHVFDPEVIFFVLRKPQKKFLQ